MIPKLCGQDPTYEDELLSPRLGIYDPRTASAVKSESAELALDEGAIKQEPMSPELVSLSA